MRPWVQSSGWHHGLIARWWAEVNVATPEELSYVAAAIRKFGEPVLDLGCGTGRILLPLVAGGLDVDGSDISADMITLAQAEAVKRGYHPRLVVQPMHKLELARMYRTIYMCGCSAWAVGVTTIEGRTASDGDEIEDPVPHC